MRWAGVLLSFMLMAAAPEATRLQQQEKASLWVNRPGETAFTVKLSESITVVMRVEGEAPLEAFLTEKPKSTTGWHLEIAGKPKVTSLDDDKRQCWEMSFLARPLQPGLHPLQMPPLQYTQKDGVEHEVKWQPVPMNITTRVAKADISEARDRTSIEELPTPPTVARPWWPWLLLAVPLVALIAFVVWRWKKTPSAKPSAQAVALKELEELGRLPARNSEDVHAFYVQLSTVLRRYLDISCGLPATQRTTAEFFAELPTSMLAELDNGALRDILRQCDLAKFANVASSHSERANLLAAAKRFVEQPLKSNSATGARQPTIAIPPAADTP